MDFPITDVSHNSFLSRNRGRSLALRRFMVQHLFFRREMIHERIQQGGITLGLNVYHTWQNEKIVPVCASCLSPFRTKAFIRILGFSLWLTTASLPAFAATGPSASADQSQTESSKCVAQSKPKGGNLPSTRDSGCTVEAQTGRAATDVPAQGSGQAPSTNLATSSAKPIAEDRSSAAVQSSPQAKGPHESSSEASDKNLGESSSFKPKFKVEHPFKPPDFNSEIFYKNKLEYSQDFGWLPINIPFPFDFMLHSDYNTYPLKYTLAPFISSFRWQIDNVKGPLILRGNWEVDCSGAAVWVARGPETRYLAWIMGMRRNFVPRDWHATPYFDWRIGLGNIDAKGPLGVLYAQGQDFTFTLNMGSGVRYNLSPRYALTAGLDWMHISNANLSEGPAGNWGVRNYGINVYGPMVGFVMQLQRHLRQSH